jgi:hypothetical protein
VPLGVERRDGLLLRNGHHMNNCKDCRAIWPFAFALSLAALVSFPAWATLSLMFAEPAAQLTATVGVFCLTGTAFVLYARWCIRRNCSLRRAMGQRRAPLVAAPR